MGTNARKSDHDEALTHDRSRQLLYDIVGDDEASFAEQQQEILQLGTEYLDVELGFVSDIDTDAETFTVLASTADQLLPTGAEYDLGRTYCRQCIESDSPLAVTDAVAEGWVGDPAYREHELGCYLGTPIRIDGELVGTVCFADENAREMDFSPVERAFVELVARLLGREMEAAAHEQHLASRERALERREEELARSEQKYESLVEAAPDAIFLADAETGEIVEVNESATALTGYDREALLGRNVLSLHPSEDAEQYEQRLAASGADERQTTATLPDGTQMVVCSAAGERIPVELSTASVEFDDRRYIQGIVRDISDRLERERDLRITNRAIEHAPVGITIAAADDGMELVYANDAFEEITGYSATTAVGRNCRFLQGPKTDRETTSRIGTELAADNAVEAELLNYRADGTPFWNNLSIAPVTDAAGETTHFVGFQHDITDRKRTEELVSVLNRVIRHNLRNEMTVVNMEARGLEECLDGEAAESAARIARAARSLTAVGERARDIQRTVEATRDPEPRDLVAAVEDAVARLREAHPDADVTLTAPDEQSALLTRTVAEALRELGTNAIEHGDGAVEFEVLTEEDGPVVRVSDTGPGLTAQERRIFEEPDETQLVHGSGLGLWFVNWVVTDVGGQIEITADEGTTFEIQFQPAG